jgi:hypothetical protein
MLLKLMNFLLNRQFVEMVEWAKAIRAQGMRKLTPENANIITPLANMNLAQLIENMKQLTYSVAKNQTYSLILDRLEKNSTIIAEQWAYAQKFQKDGAYINLILVNDILVLQETTNLDFSPSSVQSVADLTKLLKTPETILIDGKPYEMKGTSSLENFHNLLKDTPVHGEFVKYKKFEKIVNFIEFLDLNLQQLFSINQIGVIIYQNEVYLIKWVQYIDEDQLMSGKSASSANVAIIEDFGVKIGVQLKENLELGNLVVFSNKLDTEQRASLRPLLSLDESIFFGKKSKPNRRYDLTHPDDCKDFVNDVLARIETGIMLLSKERSNFIQDPKELELYIKISLQRLDGIDSANQRINILRDLLQFNQNPDLNPVIIGKFEENYIVLVKELFESRNFANILGTIRTISQLKLFENNPGILIHTIVYLFERYSPDADLILNTVDVLSRQWILSPDLLLLLEKPQILAISKNVIDRLNRGQFSEIINYLNDYIRLHPQFRSYNILSLLLQIIVNIFRVAQNDSIRRFTHDQFLSFIEEFATLLVQSERKLAAADVEDLKEKTQGTFLTLSQDSDFLAFMNDRILKFFKQIQKIKSTFLPQKSYHKIVTNIIQLAPVVVFAKTLPQIGYQLYIFLVSDLMDDSQTLQFITAYVNFYTKSFPVFQNSPSFFKECTSLLFEFQKWLSQKNITKQLLLPLKKEMTLLFTQWYLSGQVPQSDFELHRDILERWVDFIGLRDKLNSMIDILYIKDLIWAAERANVEMFQEKYYQLTASVFASNLQLLTEELKRFIATPLQTTPVTTAGSITPDQRFAMNHAVFRVFERDHSRFQLKFTDFEVLIQLFLGTLEKILVDTIQIGNLPLYQAILKELDSDFIYLSPKFLKEIYSNFSEIYREEPTEGERFNHRIAMLKEISLIIEKILPKYEEIKNLKRWDQTNQLDRIIIDLPTLTQYGRDLKEVAYQIFMRTQQWLIRLSEQNYCNHETVFNPLKALFSNILAQFKDDNQKILTDLHDLIDIFFKNQKMLNDNKKSFFRVMQEILPPRAYPEFYPTLQNYRDFVEKLADTESLYYTLKDRNRDAEKIQSIITKCKEMIQNYPHLFTPWFYYGTCLAIQEKYEETIPAYLEALKYQSTQGNYARLMHNLLVAYLSMKNYSKALELVEKMEMGIKTYPHILNLIRQIEQLTHTELLNN